MTLNERIPPEQIGEAMEQLQQLSAGQVLALYPTQRLTRSGKVVDVSLLATALIDATGKVYAVTTTERLRTSDT
jgi:two-component system CheB/CheR fusion protein